MFEPFIFHVSLSSIIFVSGGFVFAETAKIESENIRIKSAKPTKIELLSKQVSKQASKQASSINQQQLFY